MKLLKKTRRTPYNEKYPTCEEVRVHLLIYPENKSPQYITEKLGISPTKITIKGEERINFKGIKSYAKKNVWLLSSEGKVHSKDLRHHLDWLLDKIEPAKNELLSIQWSDDVIMTVDCVWWSAHGHGGPVLWPEQMKRLSELNLECGFDLYFYGDDE